MSAAADAIVWLLDQAEPEARRTAAEQLPKVPADEVVPLLVRALADDDWRVRKEAVRAATRFRDAKGVVASLVDCLGVRDDVGLKNAAAAALSELGEDVVPELASRLGGWDPDAKKLVAEILGRIPSDASVASLRDLLGDADANVRAQSAESIAIARCLDRPNRSAVARELVALARTEVPFVRVAALDAASRLDGDVPWSSLGSFVGERTLARALVRFAIRANESGAAAFVARQLSGGARGPLLDATLALAARIASETKDAPAFGALREALRGIDLAEVASLSGSDEGVEVRGASLLVLGLAATEFAVRHVTLRLKDPDLSDVAERALVLAGDAALPALVEWLGSAVPSDRRAALQVALGALGQGGSVPSPWLVSVRASVADDDPETAALAVRVLSRVGDEGDIAHVASVATHASWSVSSASTAALATLAARFPGAALAYVRRGATDGAPVPVLLALAGVLHGTPHAYDGTRALAERGFASDDPRVRRMAVLTLADAYGKEATESIAFALADEDSSVRVAAVRALGVLGEAVRLDALVAAGSDPALVGPALVALLTTDRRLAEARMLSLVRSADPVLASIAVEVSARALPSVRVEVLRVALAHATTDVVIGALAEIDSELVAALVEPLARLSADPKPEVRSLVASVFGSSSFEGARAHLVACHGRETDPIVRTVLEDALASVAGADGRDASGSAVP